ncbi:hypothetical protein QBC35DRAFT_529651 [Podospora australis]|uniref:Protein kinase domain-containing protein n=1 Tax=Podospora australis TaxID=1536484 RepID=A0AAN6X018_9PEZI|nr:hypothetical protein QBC35DRAFT_529651 [Podospora australis]
MFGNALKSLTATSNIGSNYSISSTLTATAGPWKIYSATKKSTQKEYSVFVFDRKELDAHATNAGLARSNASAFKTAVAEVVERLKKEASALARLRHPGVLELVEPVEDYKGGLRFVAEPVTASLSGLLQEKDDQERGGGFGGRTSRYVTEDSTGTRRRRELEIDELEIQKGLLQVSKALEFLHDNAGLVHGNLTPDAILVNAKSDWKLSGLSFCSFDPSKVDSSKKKKKDQDPNKKDLFESINLRDALEPDPRLPRAVQLNLDYTSPDFVLDNNLNTFADLFSLGLLCIALYNSPHKSPIECNTSISAYKRAMQSSLPSSTNNFLSSRPLPKELASFVLPRLLTRRPAQRMTAKEFQESEYFDNRLVRTIRFLDTFPAKTPNEKSAFLRGLVKVLPSFPKSVMEKKVLPALLEEMKDKELISLILHNVFKIISLLPSGKRAFSEKVRPVLKDIFVTNAKQSQEKDTSRDAGLMIIIEQLPVITANCSGKEFKDDVLPIIFAALESSTPTLINAALTSLGTVLPVLDFSTIKNELFPVIASIFSKTSSLAIKVRGLEAFVTLCGGSNDPNSDDGLDGLATEKKKATSSTALDKFTMQEKIVPLIKGIKTKEPAVMMAALNVLKVVGKVADTDFVAEEILPLLFHMILNPQFNLKEFQATMALAESLQSKVKEEITRKLQDLTGNPASPGPKDDFMSFGTIAGSSLSLEANGDSETDFEALVMGRPSTTSNTTSVMDSGWETSSAPRMASPLSNTVTTSRKSTPTATFSWSSPPVTSPPASTTQFSAVKAQQSSFRTVTPDLASFQPMAPTSTQYSQPLQPQSSSSGMSPQATQSTSINWGSSNTNNAWASSSTQPQPSLSSFGSLSLNPQQQQRPAASTSSSFALPPPPASNPPPRSGFSLAPPPGVSQPPQPQRPAFGGLGGMQGSFSGMGSTNNSSGMNSLAALSAANRTTSSGSAMSMGSMGMGMGMAAMTPTTPTINNGMTMMNNATTGMSMNSMMGMGMPQQQSQQQQPKGGLDKYESLL